MKKIIKIVSILMLLFLSACSSNIDNNTNENKLWRAIDLGDFEMTKEAILSGADINSFSNKHHHVLTSKGKITYSPVLAALNKGEIKIAEYLIDCGAEVNFTDNAGISLLQYCAKDYPKVVEKVINAGADISYTDKAGKTALDYSVSYSVDNGERKAFDILVEFGAKVNSDNINTLINSADFEKYGMLRTAISQAEPVGIDECLVAAFSGDSLQALEKFPSSTNKELALGGVAAFCSLETLKKVMPSGDIDTIKQLLKAAVLYANKDTTKYILDNYKNLSLSGEKWDILYYAAKNNDTELIDIICKSGIEYNVSQAMHSAIEYRNNDVLKFFLDNGADPNTYCLAGTALTTACKYNNIDAAEILLQRGANINGEYNGDPLMASVETGNVEIAELLIKNGADINGNNIYAVGSGGETVLMGAVRCGQLECVKLLVENGADILCEYNGETPLSLAQTHGSDNIAAYLQSKL